MLSFGGLLSELLQGGAAGLTATNPGIVKVLGGFVFPVGLVMCISILFYTMQGCSHYWLGLCCRALNCLRVT